MSMQNVASPAMPFTPPKRNSLTHIPGDEGWPIIGKTLEVLADPKGQIERQAAKYGLIYRSHIFGETSLVLLGPDANELVLFDQAKQFSSTHGWGRILGLLFPRGLMLLDFEEHRLHRSARCRHRRAGRAMENAAGTDAVLSGDEAAHARSCRHLVSRRRHRARGRRDHARLCRYGGRCRRRDPKAAARHADGSRRAGPQTHRRLLLRTNSDPSRQGRRRRPVLSALPRHPRRRRAAVEPGHHRSHELPDDGGARHADLIADVVCGGACRPSAVANQAARRSRCAGHRG